MAWSVSAYTFVVLGGAVVAAGACVWVLRHRPDPLAWPLAIMMGAVAVWAAPHAISLGFRDVESVLLWHQVRYLGTVVVPVAFFVVTLRYAGREGWLSRRLYALYAVVPAITLLLVWTSPGHGLYWQSVSVSVVDGAAVLVADYGPWYWVNLVYAYLLVGTSIVVLADVFVRAGPLYRKQTGLIVLAAVVPLGTNAGITFVQPAPTVDLTTTALAISGLLVALALFHFDLLNLRPVARDHLVQRLDDGVIVVGPGGRIVDFNPAAARVLDGLAVGQPARGVVPADDGEIVTNGDGGRRVYRVRSTPLDADFGRDVGRIVYLNDVTDVVEREQRIGVLNRVLQHNIRNELSVVCGHLDTLEESAVGADREHLEIARDGAQRVVELSEKARDIERTLDVGEAGDLVSVADVARRIVDRARETYPAATVEFEAEVGGSPSTVRVVDSELLATALENVVENAIVHNDRASPRVVVAVESADDRVQLTVADDGPGLPESEHDVLTSRTETPLEHASGLGLWLVTWTVSISSGDLTFEDNEPRGTVVTMSFPVADE